MRIICLWNIKHETSFLHYEAAEYASYLQRIRQRGTELFACFAFFDFRLKSCILPKKSGIESCFHCYLLFLSLVAQQSTKLRKKVSRNCANGWLAARMWELRISSEKKRRGKKDTMAILWPSAVIISFVLFGWKTTFFWPSFTYARISSTLVFFHVQCIIIMRVHLSKY